MFVSKRILACSLALILGAAAAPGFARDDDRDRSSGTEVNEVVVTAARVRQGGAQDINHFRGEAQAQRIPFPDDLTAEGLMGDYDLVLGADQPCGQTLCINGEAMKVSLIGRPDDRMMVGLGFGTNIDAAKWDRKPLNLVAVVDKSGSMDGSPLARVRTSLHQVVSQLRPGDQISIVLYGDRSYRHLEPTMVTASNKADIDRSIDQIASAGSTNMEAGLQVGYDTAFASQDGFKGVTRMMLFTDEQPNVGRTDAGSFMGMAQDASKRGVGLTTIGVGVQFNSALATKISSVRGGNLFFLRDDDDVKAVFGVKLDTMVSELAYDVKIVVRPMNGYKVSGVFGVPGDMLQNEGADGVSFVVPTAFFSTNGGGIFVTLARSEAFLPDPASDGSQPLITGELTYVSALDGSSAASRVVVAAPDRAPSANLKLGSVLIAEYVGLRQAATQFHANHDVEGSYQTLRQLASMLDQAGDPRLKPERDLVGNLFTQTAMLSGHAGEAAGGVKTASIPRSPMLLAGNWEVTNVTGDVDIRRGDRIEMDYDNNIRVVHRTPVKGVSPDDSDTYEANATQVMLRDSNVLYSWHIKGDHMTLYDDTHEVSLRLHRLPVSSADD
ncbi:MAG: hypothetical protein JWP35_1820 [Caulobacter sp.]|nr:hypothetical protein [Caulobacter sp.]